MSAFRLDSLLAASCSLCRPRRWPGLAIPTDGAAEPVVPGHRAKRRHDPGELGILAGSPFNEAGINSANGGTGASITARSRNTTSPAPRLEPLNTRQVNPTER